jgi:hypothetical protein
MRRIGFLPSLEMKTRAKPRVPLDLNTRRSAPRDQHLSAKGDDRDGRVPMTSKDDGAYPPCRRHELQIRDETALKKLKKDFAKRKAELVR